jgi:hypothetical protein
MEELITPDAWESWFYNPVTLVFFARLAQHREVLKEDLAIGRTFVPESIETTAMKTAQACGVIEGINYVLNKDFLQVMDSEPELEKEDEEDA